MAISVLLVYELNYKPAADEWKAELGSSKISTSLGSVNVKNPPLGMY